MKVSQHAIDRAAERYGVELSEKDIRKITHLIRNNGSVIQLCNNVMNNRQTHKLKYTDVIIYPVYDYCEQKIVTFITKEMVDNDLEINE